MSIGNTKSEGAKGHNFTWQHGVLKGLQQIIDLITGSKAASSSKIRRIQGSVDYNRALSYHGVGTDNIITITHTGTTYLGSEIIIETITYVDPAINGSNITNIQYS